MNRVCLPIARAFPIRHSIVHWKLPQLTNLYYSMYFYRCVPAQPAETFLPAGRLPRPQGLHQVSLPSRT